MRAYSAASKQVKEDERQICNSVSLRSTLRLRAYSVILAGNHWNTRNIMDRLMQIRNLSQNRTYSCVLVFYGIDVLFFMLESRVILVTIFQLNSDFTLLCH